MIFLLLQGVYFQLFVCKVIRLYNLPLQLTEQNKRTECLRKSITYRPCSRRGKSSLSQGRSSDLSPEAAPSRSRRTSGSRMPQRKSPCGRDSQQRELLPIHTAFPFNSPPRGNHCTAKIRFYRQEASDPAEYFRETRPAALRSGPFRPRCVPFPADGGATLARALYLFQSAAAQQPQ